MQLLRLRSDLPLDWLARGVAILGCVGVLTFASMFILRARTDALKLAAENSQNLSRMLGQHTARTFDSVDMLLSLLAKQSSPGDHLVRKSSTAGLLASLTDSLPHVSAVRLLSPLEKEPLFDFERSGKIGHAIDDEARKVHTSNTGAGMYLGLPTFDAESGSWVLGISRRSNRDGAAGHIVLAAVDLDYLNRFYESVAVGEQGAVGLYRDNGVLLARFPFSAALVGKSIAQSALFQEPVRSQTSGTYVTASRIDGIERIISFQRLLSPSVFITVGISRQQALAQWHVDALQTGSLSLFGMLLLIIFSELLARSQKALLRAATVDSLTGLGNRPVFMRALEGALLRAAKRKDEVSLLIVDLDGFKQVNDTLGHAAGDILLKEVGDRLCALVPKSAAVARLGGDEFAVVVGGGLDVASEVAREVTTQLRAPVSCEGNLVQVAACVGVTSYPHHDLHAVELLKNADLALYEAKKTGRDRVCMYEPRMREAMTAEVALHDEIRQSLRQERFVPFYQPQTSATSNRVTGLEALARWNHPSRGIRSAAEFASAFEQHDLAIALGKQIRLHVFNDLREWTADGVAFGKVAINVSGAELRQAGFAEEFLADLSAAAIDPEVLEIEITEGVLLAEHWSPVRANLLRLKSAGLQLSLDDFGTGYASLTHLKQFPIDLVKIDRSFIRDLETDNASASIVSAVIELAAALNLRVVAEGVETPGQLHFLRRSGCSFVQGYLIAKPMAASRIPYFIQSQQPCCAMDHVKLGLVDG